MEENKQEEITDYFLTSENARIGDVLNELSDSAEEIRLVRIKFMTE